MQDNFHSELYNEDINHLTQMASPVKKKRRITRSSIVNKLADFANVFKAFVGCNYLAIPFAFKQSGLILGILGLLLIALITDHCCLLIVKCKKAAIEQIMKSTYYCPYNGETEEYRKVERQKEKQRQNLELAITYGDLGRIAMGKWGSRLVNTALLITQFGFCVNYFIFMGDTITRMFPLTKTNATHVPKPNSTNLQDSEASKEHAGAPNVIYLMLIPLPFFLLQTFVRNIRHLGPLSAIANFCVFLGFFSILGFILSGLDLSNIHKIEWWNFSTFPIFFGQTIGAYEGIGTIIPIEASMKENRRNFRKYLHGAILLISMILGTFGILGYLHFSDKVEQLISDNLPHGTLSLIVQATLCVGVLFTYPLQMYPVVEILENFFFKETKERSTLTASFNSEYRRLRADEAPVQYGDYVTRSDYSGDESYLNGSDSGVGQSEDVANGDELGVVSSNTYHKGCRRPCGLCSCDMGWPTWKRNILRSLLVVLSFAFAYVARDYYAYMGALSGSIGSSLLGFILPCAFHIIIKKDVLPKYILVKDACFILFGIVAGVLCFVTTLLKIIN